MRISDWSSDVCSSDLIDIASAGQPLGERRADAGHAPGHGLDIMRDAVELGEVTARHLDPDRALDARREHVDAVADRRHPDIGETRKLHPAIELVDKAFGRPDRKSTRLKSSH